MLPGQKSGFWARFWQDFNPENLKINPLAGRRPAGGQILKLSRLESRQNLAREPDLRPGGTLAADGILILDY